MYQCTFTCIYTNATNLFVEIQAIIDDLCYVGSHFSSCEVVPGPVSPGMLPGASREMSLSDNQQLLDLMVLHFIISGTS